MLFNSIAFLQFLALVFVVYYAPSMRRLQLPWLILASLGFYSWTNPWLLLLLLTSIVVNAGFSYQTGLGNPSRRKLWCVFGVIVNLGLLGLFKYSPLLAKSLLNPGSVWYERLLQIPLPIGISFFSFEGISLLVDTYRGQNQVSPRPSQHAGRAGLLMVFFPHLVAGPILKAHEFIPQIGPKNFRSIDWERCFRNITTGYFLKMVIADNLKQQTFWMAYPWFEYLSQLHLWALLVGYSAQIFADFAGYSLIAIGLAGLFGYQLPDNFNFPYISASFAEFWRRWHISLSSFLKEYLYFPLGGNRGGNFRTYLNLMIVMGLGGLWHGAAWSYAVWGLLHGAALAVERWLGTWCHVPNRGMGRALRISLVFGFVTLAWLTFRLPDFHHVVRYVGCLLTPSAIPTNTLAVLTVAVYCSAVICYHLVPWLTSSVPERYQQLSYWLYGSMLFLTIVNSGPAADFIYFQF